MWSSKGDDCEFETEVVICGGGLSGIRAGLLLAQKGVRVIVLEAKNVSELRVIKILRMIRD